MKITLKLCIVIGVVFLLTAMKSNRKRVVFFGDSITQGGVSKNGYISVLKKQVDSNRFELIGAGIGGNKVYDLYLRLEDDVLAKKPDLVFIYVGINDVWHKQTAKTGTVAGSETMPCCGARGCGRHDRKAAFCARITRWGNC